MAFDNIFFQVLVYSSLITFNILMMAGIVTFSVIVVTTNSVKIKVHETLDKVQYSATNLGEAGFNVASFLGQFLVFKKTRNSFFGKWFR
jgi:hypothetical protein